MKTIYILLTQSETCVSKIINLTTDDMYTHISISFDESLEPMYSFSRKYTYSPLPAGLRIEPLRSGFYERYNYIPCALYELKVTSEVYESAKQQVESMMTESIKYQFSVIGLLLCRLNIPFHYGNLYFCSEFVSDVLDRNNAIKLPKVPSLMRPNDYTHLSELTCLFEGRLNELLEKQAAYA